MMIPHGATVVVTDGESLHLFRNASTDAHPELTALPHPDIHGASSDAGSRHHGGAANPSYRQLCEDGYAAATAAWLNSEVLSGEIAHLVIVAAPKTLGELRKHYHKELSAKLRGEIGKELTGHNAADIAKAIAAA